MTSVSEGWDNPEPIVRKPKSLNVRVKLTRVDQAVCHSVWQ